MSTILPSVVNQRNVGNVTSANTEVTALCDQWDLGAVPVTHFARDGFFSPMANDRGVDEKTLDGYYLGGYTTPIFGFTITLSPVSPFLNLLDQVVGREDVDFSRSTWQFSFNCPSLNKRWVYYNGLLINAPEQPAIGERHENVPLTFHFGDLDRGQAYGNRVTNF